MIFEHIIEILLLSSLEWIRLIYNTRMELVIRTITWHSGADRREKWELEDLKRYWQDEIEKGQLQLVNGWTSIINNIVRYVSNNPT